ncbi:MAG: 2-oxoacid:acceptor oxidoreductase family protein [Oscillospiraceae bacterium]
MMKYPQRITLCGMGGQGIILSAVILGTAAVKHANKYAVQTQSYGSEARGGQCQAEVIIDEKAINSPVAEKKDLMLSMFQEAYEKYVATLDADGVLVYDPGLVTNLTREIKHSFAVPSTQMAVDLGNRMTANMVMLGFLSEALGLIPREALIETVREQVAERFVDINLKAVDLGIEYARTNNLYYKD